MKSNQSQIQQQQSTTHGKSLGSAQTQQPQFNEKYVGFSHAKAIIWQLKFTINSVNSKKSMNATISEITHLAEMFGKDFDRYVLKELVEQVDLKDLIKSSSKDKNEQFKIEILKHELNRVASKQDFLTIFGEIAHQNFHERITDFLNELTKKLKLSIQLQLLVALSLVESCKDDAFQEATKIFKSKLHEYLNSGRQEFLPDYAVHKILFHLSTNPELVIYFSLQTHFYQKSNDDQVQTNLLQQQFMSILPFKQIAQQQSTLSPSSHYPVAMRPYQTQTFSFDISNSNENVQSIDQIEELTSTQNIQLFKENNGIEQTLQKTNKMLEPWQVLVDIGHYATYNYNYLLCALQEFKDFNEFTMAKTLLNLAFHHTSFDDFQSRVIYQTFELTKKGQTFQKNHQISDKKNVINWSLDNVPRLFRELYPNLNWLKVFEAIGQIERDDQIFEKNLTEQQQQGMILDYKGFLIFLQIFTKSKPQNIQFPLHLMLDSQKEWKNPKLQLNFIENSISFFIDKKEKQDKSLTSQINFQKLSKRQETIEELQNVKEKVQPEMIQVWQSIELVEKLIELSAKHGMFSQCRTIFEQPLKLIPEYLLLSLSQANPQAGNLLLDELLSLLLPQFLGNHVNSIPVLQHLWKNNQALMIRGICELCRHDQRIMNLSRVLDITQEVRDSLIPIVDCSDYYFAVNLGILAGKRDFLHYDVWLQSRIKDVGTPFIKALLKYIKVHIVYPIIEYVQRIRTNNGNLSEESLENYKSGVLDRSHLSKEKLCITIEHLTNNMNRQNSKIKPETLYKIDEVVIKTNELFPQQLQPPQNAEEIDNAANDYFQRVFSAEAHLVDQKISELIETMEKFKYSEQKKEQEIYACMLHSLFDEYRFLHKYPQQYLEKIAKLFGSIIKNKIIDGTLLDIALKFAFEAFRRDGRRQKFGIITIKQFFNQLPDYPNFFKDIYDIRQSLSNTDPQMYQDLEKLYQQHLEDQNTEERKVTQHSDHAQASSKKDKVQPTSNVEYTYTREEDSKTQSSNKQIGAKINENDFQKTLTKYQQQNVKGQTNQDKNSAPNANNNQTNAQTSGQRNLENTGGLSLEAAPFIRPTQNSASQKIPPIQNISTPISNTNNIVQSQSQTQNNPAPSLNLNVHDFRPSKTTNQSANMTPLPIISTVIQQQIINFQNQINAKISKAVTDNAKLSLDNLLEDPLLQLPSQDVQESVKLIFNTIAKNNFNLKLEELKSYIQNNTAYLQWFISQILTKRLLNQSQSLQNHYIEMIKQMGNKLAIEMTIGQAVDCFKKCMVIDEEQFLKVCQRGQYQNTTPIKGYLINLGSYLGGLTIGSNRPLLQKELDTKALVIEATMAVVNPNNQGQKGPNGPDKKLKYVVVFICRILKEGNKSTVFKIQNPWVNAMFSLLKEVKEYAQVNIQNSNEIQQEIESLFKFFNLSTTLVEIGQYNLLKAINSQTYHSTSQKVEIQHIMQRGSILPYYAMQNQNQPQALPSINNIFGPQQQLQRPITPLIDGTMNLMRTENFSNMDVSEQYQLNSNQLIERVTISQELFSLINKAITYNEQQIRKLLGEAVDSSIVEILPPVVDRSVTIALITTRELVIKDFAFDGDSQKILKAADLIVKNLAGSLALVTCREPLKMSLTTNLKKTIGNLNSDAFNENLINEIAQLASKENLELGCKLIKKAVIDKAQKKVREDQTMIKSIDQRKRVQELGLPFFRDDPIIKLFSELPPQLQPNQDGLTDAQFQVYEDFQNLTISNKKKYQSQASQQNLDSQTNKVNMNQQDLNIDSISIEELLKLIETQGLTQTIRNQLEKRLVNISQKQDQKEEQQKIWHFVKKWFHSACEKFEKTSIEQIKPLITSLSLIVTKFMSSQGALEDFSKKLTHEFLQLNEQIINNVELNMFLIQQQIISIQEWDVQLAMFLKENATQGQVTDNILIFLQQFLIQSIQTQKVLKYHQVPNLIKIIEQISSGNQYLLNYFAQVIDDYRKEVFNQQQVNDLRSLLFKWANVSLGENSVNQEQEINKFFNELMQREFFADASSMNLFCKVMVETSIEKAIYCNNGDLRFVERLDYRYISSFIKLIMVLMNTQNFNKHKFMIKVFDQIFELLDKDHNKNKTTFNQKPYYRLIMDLLTAINLSNCFNPQTQQLILLSMADLLIKLNPSKFPAFAFSWVELISHRQFMPHFLKNYNHLQFLYNQNHQGQNPSQSSQTSQGVNKKPNLNALGSNVDQASADNIFFDKYFRYKELIVQLYSFLKQTLQFSDINQVDECVIQFYKAALRLTLVIHKDFPDFLSDFHFNFVNSIPDKLIQLKNIILSSYPKNNQEPPNPFQKNLKVDLLNDVKSQPRILSNYDNYLSLMNLREDLEHYCRTKAASLIPQICDKMMKSEEIIGMTKKINHNVINAVVLFVAMQNNNSKQGLEQMQHKEQNLLFSQIAMKLNNETRWSFFNSIVNELRYPNSLTFYFSCILLALYYESNNEVIQEQIFRILVERLSTNKPHPWGLMITFRELLQNPKYQLTQKPFFAKHSDFIDKLFEDKLSDFQRMTSKQKQVNQQPNMQVYQQIQICFVQDESIMKMT